MLLSRFSGSQSYFGTDGWWFYFVIMYYLPKFNCFELDLYISFQN